jgi:hypothetical protein
MLAILFLIGSALFGACLARRVLRGAVSACEQVVWGLVAGWMAGGLVAYALARWQGRLTCAVVAWAALLLWAASAVLLAQGLWSSRRASVAASSWRGWRESVGSLRLKELWARAFSVRGRVGLAAVLLLFAPVLWGLFSTHTFAQGEGGVRSGGSAWYDLSFHAALASSFAYGENFPPAYTPLAGEPLLYPFLPDFHAAALMAAGLSMRAAFLVTALPLALCVVALFYTLALRVARGAAAAALATCLFLLNGGLGFLNLFNDWRRSGRSFSDFWGTLPVNYANDWSRGIHWTNLVTDTLLPQRAALYGLPAGLIIVTVFALVWQRWQDVSETPATACVSEGHGVAGRAGARPCVWRLLFAAGVLAGILPLFHTHSYIAVGLLSVFLFALRPRRAWVAFWAPAVLLAAPQLLSLARHAAGGQIVRWQPGWMGSDAPSLTLYLLYNFGAPLALAVPAWFAAPRAWRSFYVAFVLLLVFALTVVVSPNVFDNGKLTYYWHALNSVLVARWLVALARSKSLRLWKASLASVLALLSVATGVAALHAEGKASALLFSDSEVEAARFVRMQTAPRSLFLTAPAFNQPVLALAGRPVVRGATDWLWAHGYEFRAREADVRRIYAGAPDALELLSYYGVEYVYLGEAERRELWADASFFDARLPAVYRAGGVVIYDARTAGAVGIGLGSRGIPRPRELAVRLGLDPYALVEDFPRVGFFAYRILKAANKRAPARDEFMSALKVLGQGLYVGADGWERRLEENRRALALRLAGDDASRADALLSAASNPVFDASEYEEAYVYAHFFAYLGRNPGDPPDRDLSGFNFWRGVLARNGDYRSLSRAFLESEEYKKKTVGP